LKLSVLTDENIPAVEKYFGEFASVRHVNGRTLGRAQLDNADVLLVRSVTRVDEALLSGSAVKFVGTATSGFDHVDREYLARNTIGFSHAPGSNANSVVEYVLAAIAAVNDKLEQLLGGGTVGIVGYGKIGKAVAARFSALGVPCRIYDPWLERSSIPNVADLNDILGCDVVTLHAELTNRQPWPSYHLLRLPELQRLHPDALLINASRGPVVDNTSLLAHLDTHPGRSIVLDVWEGEPCINGALLARVTLGTAHIAGYSMDGKLLATRMLSEAVIRHFQLPPVAPTPPAETLSVLRVQENLSPANLIRHLIHSRYDIYLDDSLLRRTVAAEHGTEVAGTGFDGLRKSYRERRELAGTVVAGLRSPDDMAIARALGCLVDESVKGNGE
jgi:erythronate-4-phosphate dehydrogenase